MPFPDVKQTSPHTLHSFHAQISDAPNPPRPTIDHNSHRSCVFVGRKGWCVKSRSDGNGYKYICFVGPKIHFVIITKKSHSVTNPHIYYLREKII